MAAVVSAAFFGLRCSGWTAAREREMCGGGCEVMQMMTLKWLMSQRGRDNEVIACFGKFDDTEAKRGTNYEANQVSGNAKDEARRSVGARH